VIDSCNFDNVDSIAVIDLLGHYSVRKTERYTHSNKEQKLNAVELVSSENSRNKAENMENLSLVCRAEDKEIFKKNVIH
jgi:hypothetical protein